MRLERNHNVVVSEAKKARIYEQHRKQNLNMTESVRAWTHRPRKQRTVSEYDFIKFSAPKQLLVHPSFLK